MTAPAMATEYDFSDPRQYPTINGEPVPWAVDIEGPLVEARDDQTHVLWVPVLIFKAMPRTGRPDGEPLPASSD